MPLVSVIVPNYNHAAFLEERLQSIFSQTFQDFEVIILDDCSTDNSRQIINRHSSHPKVSKIVFNEMNSGSTFKQWIKGIHEANGTYIWIAESDDWCEPTFLETIMDGLLSNTSCVIGYCQSYCIGDKNEIKWKSDYPLLKDVINGKAFIEKYMLYDIAIFNASMAVWKKETFNKISAEFISYTLCGDWLFWIELCMHGNVCISGKLLNYFRKHGQDVSGKAYETGVNFIEELKMISYLHAKNIIDEATYLQLYKHQFLNYKLSGISFAAGRKALIENSFFNRTSLKPILIKYYYTWRIKHSVKSMFQKLSSGKIV